MRIIKEVERKINSKPRKILGYRSASAMFIYYQNTNI
jgi:IS30 family transposase